MADGETAASPGMKYKHYAPKAQVILVNGDSAAYAAFVNSQPGCYALCYEEDRVICVCRCPTARPPTT